MYASASGGIIFAPMPADVTTLSREELLEAYFERERILADQSAAISTYEQTISRQQSRIEWLERKLFGSTRERFTAPDAQQVLPFVVDTERLGDAVEAEHKKITVEYERRTARKHPGRLPLPEHLDIVEVTLEPDADTSGMKRIGEETTDELGYEPARFFIRRYVRPKYVTPEREDASQSVVIAALPPRPIDKCEASVELLAAITIDKHVYHLPIYRQIERFKTLGVTLPSSTVDNWQRLTALLLTPLYAAMRELLTQTSYLQVDETTIRVQDRSKPGKTHTGYLWAYHAPIDRLAYFEYRRGRGSEHCREMLSRFSGYLQTDGYVAYDAHKARADIVPLACWAHARRKFYEAQTNDAARAQHALEVIGALYDVERDARERGLSAAERKELRLERSLPLLNDFGAWLAAMLVETTPKSPIGDAVRYAVALDKELEHYLLDGALEIDNNLVENAIRPVALGRKNYLFAGSHEAAPNIAMYRTFFATCRLNGVDERRWLEHVLRTIRSTPAAAYHTLLPQNIDPELLG
jgi:transposase